MVASPPPTPTGADRRRGPFRVGDHVQLTDTKGRHHTFRLDQGEAFHTHRGIIDHDSVLGLEEGSVVATSSGTEYLAFRPLLRDYVLGMPRGAAIVYPKDAGQILTVGDIFPGARVVEAGLGSGSLALSLLRAVGDEGSLLSIERREDFASIARANVEAFFGGPHPAWDVRVGSFAEVAPGGCPPGTVDRVVLDLLAPWENLDAAADILAPGGVLTAYVATTSQMSRLAEDLRDHGGFTEPEASETIVRTWHLEGLAVRPDHRMIGHTGFLVSSRRVAPGVQVPQRKRRPAKGAYPVDGEWSAADLGERMVSEKKVRRVKRAQGKGKGGT